MKNTDSPIHVSTWSFTGYNSVVSMTNLLIETKAASNILI